METFSDMKKILIENELQAYAEQKGEFQAVLEVPVEEVEEALTCVAVCWGGGNEQGLVKDQGADACNTNDAGMLREI